MIKINVQMKKNGIVITFLKEPNINPYQCQIIREALYISTIQFQYFLKCIPTPDNPSLVHNYHIPYLWHGLSFCHIYSSCNGDTTTCLSPGFPCSTSQLVLWP